MFKGADGDATVAVNNTCFCHTNHGVLGRDTCAQQHRIQTILVTFAGPHLSLPDPVKDLRHCHASCRVHPVMFTIYEGHRHLQQPCTHTQRNMCIIPIAIKARGPSSHLCHR